MLLNLHLKATLRLHVIISKNNKLLRYRLEIRVSELKNKI